MNRIFSSLVLLSLTSFSYSQETDPKPDFYFEKLSDIDDKLGSFRLDVSPLVIGYMGDFVSFGVGGQIQVSDIANKFSVRGKYNFNYTNISTNNNKLDFVTENYERLSTSMMDFSVGYTIKTESKEEERSVTLKKSGNTETIAYMPAKVIYRYLARVGFNGTTSLSRGEFLFQDSVMNTDGSISTFESYPNTHLNQVHNSIILGFERKISMDSKYNTDKYGKKHLSSEKSFYVDLMIGLGGGLPPLYRANYNDQFYPNNISSIDLLNATEQMNIENAMMRVPVGIRTGYSQGSRKNHQIGWNVEGALYPGYIGGIRSILDLVQLRLGVSYRFMQGF